MDGAAQRRQHGVGPRVRPSSAPRRRRIATRPSTRRATGCRPAAPAAPIIPTTDPARVGRFTWVMVAPEVTVSTRFDEVFQPVQEGVTWFGPQADHVDPGASAQRPHRARRGDRSGSAGPDAGVDPGADGGGRRRLLDGRRRWLDAGVAAGVACRRHPGVDGDEGGGGCSTGGGGGGLLLLSISSAGHPAAPGSRPAARRGAGPHGPNGATGRRRARCAGAGGRSWRR